MSYNFIPTSRLLSKTAGPAVSYVAMTHPQHLFHRLHAAPEQVHVELLKSGARDGHVEVNALVQGINLNGGLRGGGQRALCALCCGLQPPHCPCAAGGVLLMLSLELLQNSHGQKSNYHALLSIALHDLFT